MKKIQIAGLTALTLLGSLSAVQAQEATTDPVGYVTVTCLANSDTIVSVPFLNNSGSLTSAVEGVITDSGATAEFTMAGITGLTTDQYVTTPSYVRFTSGTLDGNVYKIASNGATTVEIELNGDAPSDITATDTFRIYNFWTLGTLFPVATQTTIVESAGNLTFQRRSTILLPDVTSEGTRLAPSASFFLKSTGWVNTSDLSSANNTPLWPDSYFIIRHPSSVTSSTDYVTTGSVDTHSKLVIPLNTITTGPQDNFVAIPRPVDIKLSDLELVSSGAFITSAGNLTFQRRDLLLTFDNTTAFRKKAASETYFHNGTNWVNASDLSNANDELLESTQGFIIRKYKTLDGATSFWPNSPTY